MTTKYAMLITGDVVVNKNDVIWTMVGKMDINQNITQINCNVPTEVSVMKQKNMVLQLLKADMT